MSPVELMLDHPFTFVIRDVETGSTLFVGRVVNPATRFFSKRRLGDYLGFYGFALLTLYDIA